MQFIDTVFSAAKLFLKRLPRINEAYLAGKNHIQRLIMPHSSNMQGSNTFFAVYIMFSLNVV